MTAASFHTTGAGDAGIDPQRRRRVAIIADFLEERWPSMDLVAEMLATRLNGKHADEFFASLIRPRMRCYSRRSARQIPGRFDRLINRFFLYPVFLKNLRSSFALFHIADHSYAHLVHHLPPSRTIVTCHDLDTFRCLLEPERDHRSLLFRAMTRRILSGLKQAAIVICVSEATRQDLLRFAITAPDRIAVVPNGVEPIFSTHPDPLGDRAATRLLGQADGPEILHVGSGMPRKRIDLLLQIFDSLSRSHSNARLIQVGGALTPAYREMAESMGVLDRIIAVPFVETSALAAIYRRASMLMLPSEAEGFGLPLIEAMACGTPVLASDINAFREVGGTAAEYARVGDIDEWVRKSELLLSIDRADAERLRRKRIERAAEFSWDESIKKVADLYRTIAI